MKKPSETALRKACLEFLRLHGLVAWINNSGASKIGDRFVRFGEKGSSDILGCLPPDGRLLAVEVKMPGRRPTDHQEVWLARIRDSGGLAFVATSVKDVEEILRDEGYIL